MKLQKIAQIFGPESKFKQNNESMPPLNNSPNDVTDPEKLKLKVYSGGYGLREEAAVIINSDRAAEGVAAEY